MKRHWQNWLQEKKYNRHTEINISFDHLRDDVEQILYNYGEPFFDSSAIPSYYVSREAKKHLTVILNGDGAAIRIVWRLQALCTIFKV